MEELTLGGYMLPLLLVVLVIIMMLANERWKKKELEKMGIPGPMSWPIIGNLYDVITKNTEVCEEEWFDKYGSVIGYRFGQILNISIKDPEILRQVLVKNFSNFTNRKLIPFSPHPVDKGIFFAKGRTWKRIRTILSPTFSAGKLKQMNKEIERCAKLLASNLKKHAENEDTVSIKEFYGAFTMDVIASTAFGLQVDSQHNPEDPFIKHTTAIFSRPGLSFRPALFTAVMFPFTAKFFRKARISFFPSYVIDFFVKEVKAMIEDRRENPLSRPDFLQLMINAELEDQNTENSTTSNIDNAETKEKKHLSTDEIIAQAFLFFIAGYETTASLLRFASYALAINPHIQDRVLEEIQEVLGEVLLPKYTSWSGICKWSTILSNHCFLEEPNYENVTKLTYMEQVLYETLRMFPPLGRINREVAETVTYSGITLPKGASIQIPIYRLHHDPHLYPDPEVFNPDRFLSKASQNQITFVPFGFGPRICIGMRLALFEAKIALVHVLRRVKFVRCDETEVPLKLTLGRGLISSEKPIKIKLDKREKDNLD